VTKINYINAVTVRATSRLRKKL